MERKIIPYDQMPRVEPPETAGIKAYITAGTVLMFDNGETVHLTPAETDVFNVLVSSREQPLSIEEMQQKTGSNIPIPVLARRVGTLAARLYGAANHDKLLAIDTFLPEENMELDSTSSPAMVDVVEVDEGGGMEDMTYRLSPLLNLIDRRDSFTDSSAQSIRQLKRMAEYTRLDNPDDRIKLMGAAIQAFSDHPIIRKYLKELYSDNLIPVQKFQMPAEGKGEPSPDECEEAFLRIEIGFASIIEETDPSKITEACVNMINAYHMLYHRHLHLASVIALAKRHRLKPYAETFPEACVALFEHLTTSLSYKNAATFTESARIAITERLTGYINFKDDLVLTPTLERQLQRIEAARRQYAGQHDGQQPTLKEISNIVNLSEEEVVKALANPGRRRKNSDPGPSESEPSLASELEQASIQDQAHAVLQGDTLSDRQKMIVSLRFGLFVLSLRGAKFFSGSNYTYPYDNDTMPEGGLSELRISELLGIPLHAVRQILQAGLKGAGSHFKAQGFETADDVF